MKCAPTAQHDISSLKACHRDQRRQLAFHVTKSEHTWAPILMLATTALIRGGHLGRMAVRSLEPPLRDQQPVALHVPYLSARPHHNDGSTTIWVSMAFTNAATPRECMPASCVF
jgi:hypothetical protein